MARKDAKPPLPAIPRRAIARGAVARVGLALAVGVGFLAGIAFLGSFAATLLGTRERFRIPLAAVDCRPPAWIDRTTFLAEVRYLGDLPEHFNAHDRADVERLRTAIAKHPWVEFVADDGTLTVDKTFPLTVGFRKPAMAVTTKDGRERSVDAKGILLPAHGPMKSLARLAGTVEPPTDAAGMIWNDPTVTRAAELAALYDCETIERTATGWRIARRDGSTLRVDR